MLIGKKPKTEKEKQKEKELLFRQRRFILPDLHIPLKRQATPISDRYCHTERATSDLSRNYSFMNGLHGNTSNAENAKSRVRYIGSKSMSVSDRSSQCDHVSQNEDHARHNESSDCEAIHSARLDTAVTLTAHQDFKENDSVRGTKKIKKEKHKKKAMKNKGNALYKCELDFMCA